MGLSNQSDTWCGAGSKTLSGTLDRIRITTVNGTDQFDAGTVNILYEWSILMDDKTRQNWQKVKEALEAANKTSSPIYKRACIAVQTGKDPGFGS